MNLVAKEFVASRGDGDGVLVLSEFAGAAAELTDALIVNPYDLDSVAATIHDALEMPEPERRARMTGMRDQGQDSRCPSLARRFVAALRLEARRQARNPNADLARCELAVRSGGRGPCGRRQAAAGSARLRRHARRPAAVAGRSQPRTPRSCESWPHWLFCPAWKSTWSAVGDENDIEMWLGSLPVGLHAEHGLWSRGARQENLDEARRQSRLARNSARGDDRPAPLRCPGRSSRRRTRRLSGTISQRGAGTGRRRAESLTRELSAALADSTATIMAGSRVVEVKDASTDKGIVVRELAATMPGLLCW